MRFEHLRLLACPDCYGSLLCTHVELSSDEKTLIDGSLACSECQKEYPVAGGVNSAHAILEIGAEKTVEVGDVATLIGPDHDAILPHTVAERTGQGFLRIIQGMNARLPRRVV